MKIVIVATHPIQHFCPQYRSLAAQSDVDLTVVFDTLKGVESYYDKGFGAAISWGDSLLEGYDSVVLGDRDLGTILRELSPDWLIVYGYASPIARRAWAAALVRPRLKLAYIADSEQRHGTSRTMRNRVKAAVLTAMFRRVAVFLTIGDANEDYYRAHGVRPAKFVRMHFPIDPKMDLATDPREQGREELDMAPGSLVVLNVGKFEDRKRQEDLVEACRHLPDVHLLLVGSGPELEACRSKAIGMENITFLGFQDPANLPSYYAQAHVYVHPSTYDPHPLAVSEAASAGCALIVSDRTGSWGDSDDVIPGETGFVFPAGDVAALTEVLDGLSMDREQCERMGQRARQNSRRYQERAHGGFVPDLARRT